MATKRNIIFIILIIIFLVNCFSFWKFFSPPKTLTNNGIENINSSIGLINKAKKDIDKKKFCTAITETNGIISNKQSEDISLSDIKIYSLSILNGSGTPGAAKEIGDKLKENPWLEIVALGNFEKTSQTVLKFKSGLLLENKKILIEILKKDYPNFIEEIDNKIQEDIVIVLGSK